MGQTISRRLTSLKYALTESVFCTDWWDYQALLRSMQYMRPGQIKNILTIGGVQRVDFYTKTEADEKRGDLQQRMLRFIHNNSWFCCYHNYYAGQVQCVFGLSVCIYR